jgi:hypothetical protein
MPFKTDQAAAIHYGQTLCNIRDALSGVQWSTDTLEKVAEIMRGAGFHIYDSDDCDGTGPRWYSSSSGAIEIQMSLEEARSGSHQGQCDDDVATLAKLPHIAAQLAEIEPKTLRHELQDYGAWDETALADHDENLQRILWIACGDIVENENQKEEA